MVAVIRDDKSQSSGVQGGSEVLSSEVGAGKSVQMFDQEMSTSIM